MKLSPHFSRPEFACGCGCGFDVVDAELLIVLEGLRAHFDHPVTINSGARCAHHNLFVGGAPDSQHRLGKAADVVVKGIPAAVVANYLEDTYPETYGIGRYSGRTHADVRSNRARWSNT